jgi:dTDP-4-amino-4,6-dideoxygalactose transaminase
MPRQLRQYGWNSRFECELPRGCNSRFDELLAAILLTKRPFPDEFNLQRQTIAKRYIAGLLDLPVTFPTPGDDQVFHLFMTQHPDKDDIRTRLQEW